MQAALHNGRTKLAVQTFHSPTTHTAADCDVLLHSLQLYKKPEHSCNVMRLWRDQQISCTERKWEGLHGRGWAGGCVAETGVSRLQLTSRCVLRIHYQTLLHLTNIHTIEIGKTQLLDKTKKLNSVALVRKRTIPTERPPHVGEVNANFCR
jgi:hypothetical protein